MKQHQPSDACPPQSLGERFSEPEIARFRHAGYVLTPNLVGPTHLQRIDACIQEITARARSEADVSAILEWEPQPASGQAVPRRIYDPFLRHQAFRELAMLPGIRERIEQLIGADFNLHHSKLNMKPAEVGSPVEWHQDLAYFPHTNQDLVTVLIYLDDADCHNGCLQVLPGQHRRFFSHERSDGCFAGMITEDLTGSGIPQPDSLAAPAGSVIFMHCLLPHRSLANRSAHGRRSLIFEYRAADAFPIHFAPNVSDTERKAVHLQGRRARHARFGGPPPLIPRLDGAMTSLYDMQLAAARQ